MAKRTQESGIEVGCAIPSVILDNWDGSSIDMNTFKQKSALFFVSLSCHHCVDLLPHLQEIQSHSKIDILLFSTGTKEDNAEMVEYFEWDFPVISLEVESMEEIFKIEFMPFVLIVEQTGFVVNKGVVYHLNDFLFIEKQGGTTPCNPAY
jgi:hypothetical protein